MKGGIYPCYDGTNKLQVRFGKITKRFDSRKTAEKFLNHLRYTVDNETFDIRDYQKDNPLGFANLAEQWLSIRKTEVRCFRNLRNHMDKAISYLGNQNIKTIRFAELQSFLLSLTPVLSGKSKKNIRTTLHSFFRWVVDSTQDTPHPVTMPKFPPVKYEMKRRRTITYEQQQEVLAWLKENAPFKVWLGIKWLATYINVRPGELINIKEGDIDREQGVIYVRDFKGRRTKAMPLLNDDRQQLQSSSYSLRHPYFFQHERRLNQTTYPGSRFGKDYLYSWWKRGCQSVGLVCVDLYGGTRHSRAQWLRLMGRTPEEIKRATGHTTTASFNRYFEMDLEDLREIYGTGQVVRLEGKRNEDSRG